MSIGNLINKMEYYRLKAIKYKDYPILSTYYKNQYYNIGFKIINSFEMKVFENLYLK